MRKTINKLNNHPLAGKTIRSCQVSARCLQFVLLVSQGSFVTNIRPLRPHDVTSQQIWNLVPIPSGIRLSPPSKWPVWDPFQQRVTNSWLPPQKKPGFLFYCTVPFLCKTFFRYGNLAPNPSAHPVCVYTYTCLHTYACKLIWGLF